MKEIETEDGTVVEMGLTDILVYIRQLVTAIIAIRVAVSQGFWIGVLAYSLITLLMSLVRIEELLGLTAVAPKRTEGGDK